MLVLWQQSTQLLAQASSATMTHRWRTQCPPGKAQSLAPMGPTLSAALSCGRDRGNVNANLLHSTECGDADTMLVAIRASMQGWSNAIANRSSIKNSITSAIQTSSRKAMYNGKVLTQSKQSSVSIVDRFPIPPKTSMFQAILDCTPTALSAHAIGGGESL